eukprot:scaffold76048_cov70-Phaeocystis_antarctica.AAC.3
MNLPIGARPAALLLRRKLRNDRRDTEKSCQRAGTPASGETLAHTARLVVLVPVSHLKLCRRSHFLSSRL